MKIIKSRCYLIILLCKLSRLNVLWRVFVQFSILFIDFHLGKFEQTILLLLRRKKHILSCEMRMIWYNIIINCQRELRTGRATTVRDRVAKLPHLIVFAPRRCRLEIMQFVSYRVHRCGKFIPDCVLACYVSCK